MNDNQNNRPPKLHNIQILRGIAAFLVLLFHIMLMEQKWGGGSMLLGKIFNAGQSGVDLFFVISGFVMVTITRGRFQDWQAITRFLYNRIARIYPPYWFFSFILVGVYLVRPSLVNPSLDGRIHFLHSFLLLPQNTLPLLMVGWTLVYEMYFYIVFILFLLAPERMFSGLLAAWSISILAANWLWGLPGVHLPISWQKIAMSPLCLEFAGGCLVAKIVHSGNGQWRLPCLLLGTGMAAASTLLVQLDPTIAFSHQFRRLLFFGLPYMLVLYGMASTEIHGNVSRIPALERLGDASYSLYLSHTIVLNGIGWLWATTMPGSGGPLWLTAMTLCALAAGFISFRIIEQPAMKLLKRRPVSRFHSPKRAVS